MVSRRSVLVGIGGVAAGGGVILSTGAFTTVEAERTVTLETAADADAFLGLQIREDLDAGGDMIDLDFAGDSGFNLNARTVLDKVLLVTNNGEQDDVTIDLEVESVNGNSDASFDDMLDLIENNDGSFDDGSGGGVSPDGAPLDPGESAAYDLELELRESQLSGDAASFAAGLDGESDFDVVLTITAEADN